MYTHTHIAFLVASKTKPLIYMYSFSCPKIAMCIYNTLASETKEMPQTRLWKLERNAQAHLQQKNQDGGGWEK